MAIYPLMTKSLLPLPATCLVHGYLILRNLTGGHLVERGIWGILVWEEIVSATNNSDNLSTSEKTIQ